MIKLWPKENGRLKFECDLLEVDSSVPQESAARRETSIVQNATSST